MVKNIFKALSLAFAMAFVLQVNANHILGGNITFECVGPNTYGVTLTIYKDCFGATASPSIETIFFFPSGCSGVLPLSVAADFQNEVEISDLCPTEAVNSSCLGGVLPGVQAVTYYKEVVLDPACQWNAEYTSGDWNYFVNMDVSGLPTALIQTQIDLTQGCNSTITIAPEGQVSYYCLGDAVTKVPNVANPNGYDLTYSLVCPQIAGGVDAPMFTTCDDVFPGMTIDPTTGQVDFVAPMVPGNYLVSIAIEMSSGGNVIGTVYENMFYTVRLCDVTASTFDLPEIQTVGAETVQLNFTDAEVCVGDTLFVTIQATNTNTFRSITLDSNFETIFPGGTFTQNGTNPAIGEMMVVATDAMIGTSVVDFDLEDDSCPVPTLDDIQLNLTVNPSLEVSLIDTLVCFGQDITVTASGDTDFIWTLVSGQATGLSASGPSQTFVPLTDCEIEIQAVNATGPCNFRDTLNVAVALQTFDANITNESCQENDGAIDLEVNGGTGAYSYNWVELAETTQDVSALTDGTYNVIVTDDGVVGCSRDTTITVSDTPPPTGEITTQDVTICTGENVDIAFDLTGTAPFTIELLNSVTGLLEATPSINASGEIYQVSPNATTTYTLQQITDGNTPSCFTNTNSSVTVTVRPFPTASFIDPGAICNGDNVDLELSIDQTGSYNIIYTPTNGTPASPATLSDGDVVNVAPTSDTTYEITEVSYTDAPACPNTTAAPINLVVYDLPSLVFTGDQTICSGDNAVLNLELTGAGPWSIVHDFPGQPSPFSVNDNSFAWDIGTLNTSTTVTISQINDQNCSDNTPYSVTISVNELPTGLLLSDQAICAGSNTAIEFELQGAGPFDVVWNDGIDHNETGISDGFIATPSYNTNTQVCLTSITDSNNPACSQSINECIDVTVNDLPDMNITGSSLICEGDCQDVPLNILSGSGPFEIDYEMTLDADGSSVGGVQTMADINNGDFINLCPAENATVALLAVRDASTPTCESTVSSTYAITVNPFVTVDFAQDTLICEGTCADLEIGFSMGQGPVEIEVNGVLEGLFDLNTDLIDSTYILNVCPLADQAYTITNIVDQNNPCVQILNDVVMVDITGVPTASFVQDEDICTGGNVNLEFVLPAGGSYDVDIETDDGTITSSETLNALNNGAQYNVSPSETTTYTILTVTDQSTAATCASSPNFTAEVTVNTSPVATVQDTICANTADSYQIVFTIEDGDPTSYVVTEPGDIVENAGTWTFTSDPVDPTIDNTWNLNDANNCDPSQVLIEDFVCPIVTYSGTVDLTPLDICSDGVVSTIFNNDAIFDDNDVLTYVIHNSPNESLGLVYYINNTGSWDVVNDLDFSGTLDYGTTYYISTVAGDDDGAGNVDFMSAGISVSQGVPVTFYEIPTVTVSGGGTICAGQEVDVVFDFTGTGPYTVNYQIDAAPAIGLPINFINTTSTLSTGTAGTYSPISLSNPACQGVDIQGQAEVVVNDLPTSTLGVDGSFCAGGTYELDLELTGGPDWTVTITQDDGSGNLIDDTYLVTDPNSIYPVSDSLLYFVNSVTDGNNCTNDIDGPPVMVTIDPLPTASFQFGDSAFCAGSEVNVLIDLTGSPPWDLTYTTAAGQQTENILTSPFGILVNSTETITLDNIQDGIGCDNVLNEQIQLTEIAIPTVDAGPDLFFCSGETTTIGTLENPAYTYEWTPEDDLDSATDGQTTITSTNETGADVLTVYTLTAREGFCESTSDVQVTVHPLPIADAGEESHICYGQSIQLNATGGDTYLWQANAWIAAGDETLPNPTITPLVSTELIVTVTDALNCSNNDTVSVFVPEEFTAMETFDNEVCFDVCNGNIELESLGSWGEISVDWAQVAGNDFVLTDLCAGSYDYTLTDSIGCELFGTIEILELPDYFFDDALVIPPTCFGENTGIIEVISTTAVQFEMLPAATTNATGIFNGLSAGTYEVIATDDNGCLADTTFTFTSASSQMNLSVATDTLTICTGENITLSANGTGGDGNITYNWYNTSIPAGFESNDNPYTVAVPDEVTYFIYTTDGNGCSSDTLYTAAVFDTPITVSAGPSDVIEICQGECVDLFAEASGGNGILDIEWFADDSDGPISISNLLSLTDCPQETTEYVVFANDGCSGTASDTIDVTVFLTPVVEISADEYSSCYPHTVELFNDTDPNLVDACVWDLMDGNPQPVCGSITYTYADPGVYFPELTVTSINGCTSTGVIDVPIEVYDYPIADFTWTPDPVTVIENEVQLINQSIDGANFNWDISTGVSTAEENPSFIMPPEDLALADVCLEAINLFGCADTLCRTISLKSELIIYVPNSFTPDNDGVNDVFFPVVSGFDRNQYIFRVWARSGVVVYETRDPDGFWDGSNAYGDGQYYVQDDVYVWEVILIELETGDKKNFTGSVTPLR